MHTASPYPPDQSWDDGQLAPERVYRIIASLEHYHAVGCRLRIGLENALGANVGDPGSA
jgi:hypothetical protein